MTGGAYQTGKNPAFQFVGDIMGGYDTPYQQLSWLYYGGVWMRRRSCTINTTCN
ncbi:MAG: hypothetical protein R3E89_18920 [Thiolinea sp.]